MQFLSMCFTVPYLLVNYVRIKIYIIETMVWKMHWNAIVVQKALGCQKIIKDFVLLSNMGMESEDDMSQVTLNNIMHFALD